MGRASIWVLAIALASSASAAQPPAQPSPPRQAPASAGQAPQTASASQGAPPQPSPAPQAPAGGPPSAPSPAGQAPASAGQAPAASAPQAGAAAPPSEPVGFTYNPEGRRDPFVSLLRRGTATRTGTTGIGARPAGLAGLEVAEVTLRGTVKSREGFVAILQGVDQKTYIVRAGDKLFDGTVRTISQNELLIVQQVNDPLSLEKQREVRKVLRQAEAN